MSGERPRLARLSLAEDPAAWRALGFTTGPEGACRIGATELELGAHGDGGIVSWVLEGASGGDIDGLPTGSAAALLASSEPHPNSVVAIDHVVVTTPDTQRTFAALEAAGLELRAQREAGGAGRPLLQGFFLLREALVEVVGPQEPEGGGPARFWGLTLVSADLDRTGALMGAALGPPRDAVQPGRRIAVATPAAGLALRLAVMTPR